MKKEKYIVPEMEIVMFESEDIITTSPGGNSTSSTTMLDDQGNEVYIDLN